MKNNLNTINCPKCGQSIDVNKLLSHQMQEEFQTKFENKLKEEKQQIEKRHAELNAMHNSIEKQKDNINHLIEKGIQDKLMTEKIKIEKGLRLRIEEEKSTEIKSYLEQLDEKVKEAKEYNKLKADFVRLQREKNEIKEKIEAELEQSLSKKLEEEKIKIKQETQKKSDLKISEKEMVIQQLKNQLQIAQRKAEQGSMQIQGEVQELAIEEFLKNNFPNDSITEIKKGARGADCLHLINLPTQINCGSIYYESKRTKDFQKSWLEKFKVDMREVNAQFGMLVTECYPKGMERMGQFQGIWICTFEEFQGLCYVLREAIILLHQVTISQEDKGDKMEMMYKFLTGNECKSFLEAIAEAFAQMQEDLLKEKRSFESIWKQREKQIHKVFLNTTQLYGCIKGIAGKSVASIKLLELPDGNNN